MTESPYYTTDEAASILRKHRETVQRLCQRGKIEGARKIGGEWYIPRTSIDPAPPVKKPITPQAGKEQGT